MKENQNYAVRSQNSDYPWCGSIVTVIGKEPEEDFRVQAVTCFLLWLL